MTLTTLKILHEQLFAAQLRTKLVWPYHLFSLLLFLVVLFIFIFSSLRDITFPLDDAYIVLHNAQSLLAGDDNFAGARPLTGSTSLIFTLATALFLPFLPGPWILWLLSWLGILAASLGFARIVRNLGGSPSQQVAITAAALLAGQPMLVMLNGLETGWVIAAVGWALALASNPRPSIRLIVICGLLPFLRPELGALAVLLVFDQARRRHADKQQFRDTARVVALDGVMLLAVSLPLLVVQWMGSGTPFPNTGSAKLYFFAGHQLALEQKLSFALITVGRFLIILGPVFLSVLLVRNRISALGSFFFIIVVSAYAFTTPTILFHNDFRYLYILTPVLAANLTGAITSERPIWRVMGIVILTLSIGWNAVSLPSGIKEYVTRSNEMTELVSGLAIWIVANLDPKEQVLIHDIGYVAYATSQPLNDLVGLKNPENIPIHRDYTRLNRPSGRGESIERIALKSGARILVVSRGWEPSFQMAAGLRNRGWSLTPLSTDHFPSGYQIYRITPPQHR